MIVGATGLGALVSALAVCAPDKPNIVFVLTDDQDHVLGGSGPGPLPRAHDELTAAGAQATNWFVHTPVCCPSRSEILTGRMFHNLAFKPNSKNRWDTIDGVHAKQCMHINEKNLSPGPTFAGPLAAAGYRVGFFGKYLNISPRQAPTGAHTYFVNPGPERSPYDSSGEYYPNYWYHVTPTFNGTFNFSGLPMASRYETAFIGNRTTQWIRDAAEAGYPFFLYAAPHAPHGASIPAPWYNNSFPNITAPITPSVGYHGIDHHWLVAQQPPVQPHEFASANIKYRQRWECLLSVDDLIIALRETLQDVGILESTYFFYSSDHGFHFNQLRLGTGKWNVYDTDVRVHMYATGPGIKPGSTFTTVGQHIDFAPTWLGLAGISTPVWMDGRSIVADLVNVSDPFVPLSVKQHIDEEKSQSQLSKGRPNNTAYIEYHGLGPVGAPARLLDTLNNTYRAVRILSGDESRGIHISSDGVQGNLLYAEFASDYGFDSVVFREVFDLHSDPWQMHNLAESTDPLILQNLSNLVRSLWQCQGNECR